ncbi:thiol reductase thioredoxin [Tolypothrix bouteillei VB521301]|uniref:Thioredoxin n=1 Tax=Tolypothrix bouteillei VB521301 TaxID=1479485 RepID=A0A0C1NFD1_9CYAN|nr:thioredoxin domain-containing protein [Tolypothrix bouteillei]KAF3890750.1 thiol reductase thioredoxin [Tolypothrix bouteillei VB521301]
MAIKQQFQNFEELLYSSNLPTLVVFVSPQCGPSHLIDTCLEQVQNQMKEQILIVRIDSEKYSDLASKYQAHPLPTLLLFKNGEIVARIEEEQTEKLMTASSLLQRLQSLL